MVSNLMMAMLSETPRNSIFKPPMTNAERQLRHRSKIRKLTYKSVKEHEGWKEATIAWAVCASIHREYAKGKDPFFTTRQKDFTRHENDAREKFLALVKGEVES